MTRWIVTSSLKARRAVVLVAVAVMAFGVWQLRDAKVDALPEFKPPTVEVQTEALGLSSEEVEQLITVPLEQDLLDGVAWLDKIRSESVPGLSSVQLIFKPGTDLYRARQVVQERISQAAGLPNVSRPPQMLQPRASTSRTVLVALSSKDLSALQIGVLARWTIRPRLLAVSGVSNVAIWGQRERQLQVQVDPKKLQERNVKLEQVIRSTGNALWVSPLTFLEASTPGTGGFIDTPQQRLGIQHNLPIIGPADLGEVSIDDTSPPLKIADVATVVEDHQPLIGDAVVDGQSAGGFLLAIEKLPKANTSDVTNGVEEALRQLAPGLKGLKMDASVFRPATYVHNSVGHLRRSTVTGAALLLVVLTLMLFSWRAALTVLASVTLSFVAAALVLHLLGTTFNAVVFAGLVMALAAVVDDAVVNVDNVVRRLREHGDPPGGERAMVATAVRRASLETGRTVVWATVVFAVALVPIFLMDGLSGDSFYPPLAASSLLALVVSLGVAITVTPALSVALLHRGRLRTSPLTGPVRRGYERALAPFLRTTVPALVVVGAVLVAAALLVPRFHTALLPPLKDTNLLVRWEAPFGTSLPEMNRVTARASQELRRVPGVRDVGVQVGQASLGDQAVGSDSAEMWVRLAPAADYGRTVAAVTGVVDGYPGLRHEVVTYSKDRMREVLGQTKDPITVRVFGNDLDVLRAKANDVKGLLTSTKGVRGARVASQEAEPTMQVDVDIAKARQFGLTPGDVRRAATTLVSGLRVGNLFEDQKVFDVTVWSAPQARHSVSSLQNLLIDTPTGAYVRLGDVAGVSVKPTVPVIRHQDISRFLDVTADVSGRNVGSVASDVKHRLGRVGFPLEYHAELLGDYARQHHAQQRLAGFAVAAAVVVFLLLQAAFGSWRLAIIIFGTLPVSLAGGVVAARIDDPTATLATVAGLLAVLAFTLRNDLVLVTHLQDLRAEADGALRADLVARGMRERLLPTAVAAACTAAVVLPAIAFGDVAGQELVHPMAIVLVGGLITSALVSMFVLPSLYLRFGPRRTSDVPLLEHEPAPAARPMATRAQANADWEEAR